MDFSKNKILNRPLCILFFNLEPYWSLVRIWFTWTQFWDNFFFFYGEKELGENLAFGEPNSHLFFVYGIKVCSEFGFWETKFWDNFKLFYFIFGEEEEMWDFFMHDQN